VKILGTKDATLFLGKLNGHISTVSLIFIDDHWIFICYVLYSDGYCCYLQSMVQDFSVFAVNVLGIESG